MPLYQYHFIGPDGGRPTLDFAELDDDGMAAREAMSQLRRHGGALAVEVWEAERLVLRVGRPPGEIMSSTPAVHGAGHDPEPDPAPSGPPGNQPSR